jgi:multidrug efflux pump subunit AcrA (membrane-fusion protein)
VESAKAQLDAQLLRLKHTQVLAPDSGIISARSATLGAVVGTGTELFRLIRQGRLEWRAEVTSANWAYRSGHWCGGDRSQRCTVQGQGAHGVAYGGRGKPATVWSMWTCWGL